MQNEKTEGGKKDGGSIQDVEKKYGLDKYEKSEFLKQMEKEYVKIDKKLVKISNYEKMKSEGKELNAEMEELIAKKDQFMLTIKSYKTALDAYQRTISGTDDISQPKSGKDMGEEAKGKTLTSAELKKINYFFAIVEVLKAEVNPNPLSYLPEGKRSELLEMVNRITDCKEDTCLAVMAAEVSNILSRLLRNGELSDTLNQIMKDNKVTGMKFRFSSAKGIPSTATHSTTEGKPGTRKQPKEESEMVQEKSGAIKESNEPRKGNAWADDISNESEDSEEEKVEEKEDDGFETVLSKDEARRLKEEEGSPNTGRGGERGRRRGHGRGREWRGEGRPRGFRGRRGGN
jgi:hypothetical protein